MAAGGGDQRSGGAGRHHPVPEAGRTAEKLAAKALRVIAERRLGEILAAMPKASGSAGTGRPTLGGTKSEPPKSDAPTLADIGIDKKTSSRALATTFPIGGPIGGTADTLA